jgi:hypothetical protein
MPMITPNSLSVFVADGRNTLAHHAIVTLPSEQDHYATVALAGSKKLHVPIRDCTASFQHRLAPANSNKSCCAELAA